MAEFAEHLSRQTKMPVEDRTGLEGPYSIDITSSPPWIPPAAAAAGSVERPTAPPLDAALREQLGLRLDRMDIEIDVIDIDSIEPPTEN